jgi:hypothetical protein
MARTPALKSMPAVACDAPCSTTNWSTPVDTLNEIRSSTRTVAGTEAVASGDWTIAVTADRTAATNTLGSAMTLDDYQDHADRTRAASVGGCRQKTGKIRPGPRRPAKHGAADLDVRA